MKSRDVLESQVVQLEMEVKVSKSIITKLRNENELMKEYEEAIIDRDEQLSKLKKKMEILGLMK